MIYLQIFWVFLITNLLGFGGGPAIIPLVQHEVVVVFGWLTEAEFAEVLAMGNALPGPIAPKMASYIGFQQAGILGATVALFATVAPSLALMLPLMGVLKRYQDSPQVQRLTKYIRPTIAVLLGLIAYQSFVATWVDSGPWHLLILSAISFLCLAKFKVHPVFVVLGAMLYGVILLS